MIERPFDNTDSGDEYPTKKQMIRALEALSERWEVEASRQGSVPYGSIDKAQTYSECSEDLAELIKEFSDDYE